jgi:hypothetical protein
MARKKNVIAPNDEKSLMAVDKMAAQIEKARELYGDGQPFDEERILDCIEFKAGRAFSEICELGKYCLWYKAEVGHGHFLEGLERREINVGAANWAMLMVERFGDKFHTVWNLGTRKARMLTTFTKEEIDEYAKGGLLRDIPHDDVKNMTVSELDAEVQRLRKNAKNQKEQHGKEVEKLREIISDLKTRAEDPMQLTPGQKAARELRELTPDYSIALAKISAGFREAMSILNEGEKIPGIGVQELNEWTSEFVPDSATIHELFTQWQYSFENPGPVIDNFNDIIEGKADVQELG